MKKAIVIFLGITMVGGLKAQQLPHYTQYLINDFPMNPAIGGSHPYFEAKSNHRYQWVGITDAPRTYIFSLNGPLKNGKMGVGGTLFTDITGPTRRTGLQFSYAYHLRLGETLKLSLGITGGMVQFLVDGAKITTKVPGDIALSNGVMSVLAPDAGAGLYLYSDNLFLSISSPQLIPYKLKFFEDYNDTQNKMANHLFVFGGYKIDLSDDFTLEPSVMFKYVSPAPAQIEPTLRAIYQDQVWLGVSYRTSISPFEADAIGVMFGYTFQKNLTLGYSFDISQSNIKNYSSGTHELMLGIKFRNRGAPKDSEASIQ